MAEALALDSRVLSEISRLMASAHPEMSEIERDHASTMLATKSMAQAIPGVVRYVRAVHAIGRHTICEFEVSKGPRNETAYAALEAL